MRNAVPTVAIILLVIGTAGAVAANFVAFSPYRAGLSLTHPLVIGLVSIGIAIAGIILLLWYFFSELSSRY